MVDGEGNHFSGLLPTAFLLFSPDYDMDYIREYILKRKAQGAAGFRTLINCCWGPTLKCEHGGNTIFWGNSPLHDRIEAVLDFLQQNGMHAIIETGAGDSTSYAIGKPAYTEKSPEWLDLLYYMVYLSAKYGNLIIGTGNEPAKRENPDAVLEWQNWAVDTLKERAAIVGTDILVTADIMPGTGVPTMSHHSAVDIVGWVTPRSEWFDGSVGAAYLEYRELRRRSELNDKVIHFREPPRRNYRNMGDWTSPEAKEWLREIMFLSLGSIYTPHGLGNGEEEEQPPDGSFLWGVGDKDYPESWKAYTELMQLFRFRTTSKRRFDFVPDDGWYLGGAFGFSADKKIYVAYCHSNGVHVGLPGPGTFTVFNPVSGEVEWGPEYKTSLDFITTGTAGKIIVIKKGTDAAVSE